MTEFITETLQNGGLLYQLVTIGLLLLGAAVGGRVASWLWAQVVFRLRSVSKALAHSLAGASRRRVGYLVLLILLQPALDQLGAISSIGSSAIYAFVGDALYVGTVLAAALVAEALIRASLDWYLTDMAHRTDTTLDEQVLPLLKRFNIVVVLIIALTIVLGHFGVELGGLLATAGIASLAVALAAQDTLSNMFAGVSLALDRPFRDGDRIELADGTLGKVTEVGLRTTKILTQENTVLIIPNKQLADDRITNHVYPDERLRLRPRVGVAYGSDMHLVKRLIYETLAELEDILDEPEPRVHFLEFGDSALVLRVVFWIEDYRKRFDVSDEFNMRIKDVFASAGVDVPFPTRTLVLGEAEQRLLGQIAGDQTQPRDRQSSPDSD